MQVRFKVSLYSVYSIITYDVMQVVQSLFEKSKFRIQNININKYCKNVPFHQTVIAQFQIQRVVY